MGDIGFSNWDLTPFFSALQGEDYAAYVKETEDALADLEYQAQDIQGLEAAAEVICFMEKALSRLIHLTAYLECASAEDSASEIAQEELGRVDVLNSIFRRSEIFILEYLRNLSEADFAVLLKSPKLDKAQYYVERMRYEAVHSMSLECESLAADLDITGFRAWERLYETLSGKLNFDIKDSEGKVRTVPMSLKVSLLEDPDPVVRSQTLAASNKAWENIGEVIGACLNNIAGHRLNILKRRGIEHFLDNACFESGLSRKTLDVMMETVSKNYDLPRRYLKLKAKMCGLEHLGFQDLYAPIPGLDGGRYTWQEGTDVVVKAFTRFDPKFGEFASKAIADKWVESEVRSGKKPGGFCTSSTELGQSRIFMTYQGNYGDVSTLAHELGHAWHEWQVRDMRHYCHAYPMTLAETASTFAEQLLKDYLLSDDNLDKKRRMSLLSRGLDDMATYLLNIPMRFYFEKSFYEKRSQGELSLSRLKSLMEETQKNVYGDILDSSQLDPWFWASKGHFYITSVSFYNFPYTFGYLFSLGVYSKARREGAEFLPRFRELLRSTGCGTCEKAALDSIGADLEKEDFWLESLSLLRDELSAFEALAGE